MKKMLLVFLVQIFTAGIAESAERPLTPNLISNMATVIVAGTTIPRIEPVFGVGVKAKALPATSNAFKGKRKLSIEDGIDAICDGKPSGGRTDDPNNCNVVINYEDRGKYEFFSVTAVKSQKIVTWLIKK